MLIFWLIAFVAFVVIEFCTVQLISIWFALGSLLTFILTYLFGLTFFQQLVVFIISSGVFTLLTFPLRKKLNAKKIDTNYELNIGRYATVIEEINFATGSGRVSLEGVDWMAVPYDKDLVIPEGSVVVVKEVSGSKLIVSPKGPEDSVAEAVHSENSNL